MTAKFTKDEVIKEIAKCLAKEVGGHYADASAGTHLDGLDELEMEQLIGGVLSVYDMDGMESAMSMTIDQESTVGEMADWIIDHAKSAE